MATDSRWKLAQNYEQSYWQKTADRIASGVNEQFHWYEWKTREMEKKLGDWFPASRRQDARVLEIGSGPIGIVSFLGWGERHAIDPLEDFYRTNQGLCELRKPEVNYRAGTGEQLPFDDNGFSLVVIDNVIDHVRRAEDVMKEIFRVLSGNGILYLAVNIHTSWGGVLHSVLSKAGIDKGHPYTFTLGRIRQFMKKNGFTVLSDTTGDYREAKDQDRRSSSIKDRIKGYTGLSEFVYYCVASKTKI